MNWAGLGNSFQLFVGYFLIVIICIVAAVRFSKPGRPKWAAGLGVFVVFWGLTLIDDILGAREHRALCEKEGGVKIYRQASLPAEFYLPDGRPKFINQQGGITDRGIEKTLAGYIKFEHKGQESYSSRYLKIDKDVRSIVDAKTSKLLAQWTQFRRWPSPFVPSLMHSNAIGCGESAQATIELSHKFYRLTFPNLILK